MNEKERSFTRSFTGRSRQRTTRKSVLVADRAARSLITVGGIGTIAAVLGVALFLVWVVLPLFLEAEVEGLSDLEPGWGERPLHVGVDEYQLLGWALLPSGRLDVFRIDSGETISSQQWVEPGRLSVLSTLERSDEVVLGFRDGTVRTAEVGFESQVLNAAALPPEVVARFEGERRPPPVDYQGGLVERTPQGQFRHQRLRAELKEETRVGTGTVRRLRHVVRPGGGPLIVTLVESSPAGAIAEAGEAGDLGDLGDLGEAAAAGPPSPPAGSGGGLRLVVISGDEKSSFLTGESELVFDEPLELPYRPPVDEAPAFLELSGTGEDLYLAWESGELQRYALDDLDAAFVAERGRLIPEDRTLTAFSFILGRTTLVWGDSAGEVRGGFQVRLEELVEGAIPTLEHDERARSVLVEAKDLATEGSAALAFAPSDRSRLLLTGFADGHVQLANVTTASLLRDFELPSGEAVLGLRMAPKEDGLIALTESGLYHARLDPRYPEASFKALFRPVWYEGYNEPRHMWQSSSASDDFEPKLGLIALIFGTLKATVYSMLFGAPLALLAAIFTSEFLHPRAKAAIKPTIELMASLPSVVLGFLAALVFAPFIEDIVPATLVLFVTLPLAFLLGAYAWQLAPQHLTLRFEAARFAFIVAAMPLGILLAFWLGPVAEDLFFAGDIKGWLAWGPDAGPEQARFESSIGGWMLMWLPLSALGVALASSRFVSPVMREKGASWSRRQFAVADVLRFLATLAFTFAVALALSTLFDALGFDPRGGYVDTYVQRNALVVGFVMGFAIIPIIYTISEDALSTVPEHLRSASLGAGATPWQTAVRIVIPTAMSGLFSALMIGLGRAVGETMIVLMAAGNTPVLEWNIFEGFRTLSANIAVELPEAVRNSTHYRTLFLAALVLFVMTFLVNTVAEIVRLRFRKRAYQL